MVEVENLIGSQYDDFLTGNAGNNVLAGGAGFDVLTGGAGADIFQFDYAERGNQSVDGQAYADSVVDFSSAEGDKIDLSRIDANTGTAGNQEFHFIGGGDFTGAAGELRVVVPDNAQGYVHVEADINGDGAADLIIQVSGDFDHDWSANDFMM
ncbi:M10 family metallopeptidase C-terminal domain-containing protein [Phyllobacterium sp. 2063]|nr:M10 family metallopeptidase C-terminal domain-containing protein [Phyllobacterium sp. 2063]